MPLSTSAIGSAATRHGGQLQARGYSVSQVVHHYGEVCQAVTELAAEQQAPITPEEFHTLNGCLDTAIAEAVTEHTRMSAEQQRRPNRARRTGGARVPRISSTRPLWRSRC